MRRTKLTTIRTETIERTVVCATTRECELGCPDCGGDSDWLSLTDAEAFCDESADITKLIELGRLHSTTLEGHLLICRLSLTGKL